MSDSIRFWFMVVSGSSDAVSYTHNVYHLTVPETIQNPI